MWKLLMCLAVGFFFAGCSSAIKHEEQVAQDETVQPIVDSSQFGKINMEELVGILGEPESKDEWNFESANGQKYKAITWVYDDGNQEFLFIDNKVVRFTFYGTGQVYKDGYQALALFGITPGPNIKKSADTGTVIRFQQVDDSMKVDDFWLLEGDTKKSIGTVKITYDSRYF